MSASYRYGGTGRGHIGAHRMSAREARWRRTELLKAWPATARVALVWAELLDWLLQPLRPEGADPAVLPVCAQCRDRQHIACGSTSGCGCYCEQAASGRRSA